MTSYGTIARRPLMFCTFSEPVLAGRYPRGQVTLLAGAGGVGKGQICIWLAVDTAMQGHDVILVTPEDELEATVRPRLEATVRAMAPGCDEAFTESVLSRVHDLTYTASGAPFELSADGKHEGSVGQLRELVDNPTLDLPEPDAEYAGAPARLVIIDPLSACLAYGTVATNQGARRLLAPLTTLARETGCGFVMTLHTTKDGRVIGSKGLTDAARLVYRAYKDPQNPRIRVLAIDKTNGPDGDPVRYAIRGEGADTFVQWLDFDALARRRLGWREGWTADDAAMESMLAVLPRSGLARHASTLAEDAGLTDGAAVLALDGLAARGMAEEYPEHGWWRLAGAPVEGRPALPAGSDEEGES